MLSDAAVIGAVLLAGSSIVAWIKFWMDQGRVKQNAESALSMGTAALGHAASVKDDLARFQIQQAHEALQYLRKDDLKAIEDRIATSLREVKNDIHGMSDRLDRVLELRAQS